MGKIRNAIENLQGEDKMLYEQIKELVDDLDPANVYPLDDYDYAYREIFQILKGGGGKKEIYDYLFPKYSKGTYMKIEHLKHHFYKLACAETAQRLAGLYSIEGGFKPFDIKKKCEAVQNAVNILLDYVSRHEHEKTKQFLAGYDLPILVQIAAKLLTGEYKFPQNDIKSALRIVLFCRKQRMKENFKWTDENLKRLTYISECLFNACVKCRQEGEETAALLDSRLKQAGAHLKDYELSAVIHAYPHIDGDRKAAAAVESYLAKQTLPHRDHVYFRNSTKFWQEKEVSWLCQSHGYYTDENYIYDWGRPDVEGYFPNGFNRERLCHAIWGMLSYPNTWSVPDILSIWHIKSSVEINQQYYEDI
jgi:hypothetical protein